MKNIPIGNEKSYKLRLIESVENLIKKIRWKAIFYNTPNDNKIDKKVNYGLKSTRCPSHVKELLPFENHLLELVKNIKFRKTTNEFQKRMKVDITSIKNFDKKRKKEKNIGRITLYF